MNSRTFSSVAFLLVLGVLFVCFPLNEARSQDGTNATSASAEEEIAGSLVLQDTEGNLRPLKHMVTSEQHETIIERLTSIEEQLIMINAKLEAVLPEYPEDPSGSSSDTININTATFDELLEISGIGKVKAGAIIAERLKLPVTAFSDWDDLASRVSGIGPGTIEDIRASGNAVIEPISDTSEGQ